MEENIARTLPTLPLDQEAIKKIIPHRDPFLFVDRVTEFVDGVTIVGFKQVSPEESYFRGHFPGRPIMPGVIILEALAQLGAVFAKLSTGGSKADGLIVFSGADEVRFRKVVVPGDLLRLEMSVISKRTRYWKMQGLASVGDDRAAEGILLATEV